MKKISFFKNAFIMILSSFFLRFLGMWFRVYLARKIGAEGMGTYQLIFSVFVMSVALATSGIFLVTVRLVSECIGKNEQEKIRSTVSKCVRYGLFVSLSATVILFSLSNATAKYILADIRCETPLKILALGLPFMSCCACLKGYFVANRDSFHPSFAEIFEQIITIAVPFIILKNTQSIEKSILAIMLGSTLGEIASFSYILIAYKISVFRRKLKKEKTKKLLAQILHISVPGTISSTARSLLSTTENLLIPYGLKRSGTAFSLSLAKYGILHGMAYPALLFPSAILFPFSSLLVPEISEARARKDNDAVSYYIGFSLKFSLWFSIPVSLLFWKYTPQLSVSLYNNAEAGDYMRVLSPIIPLIYTDHAVDGILKGLDEQIATCKCNLFDGALRVLLILIVIPKYRISGYIVVLFISCVLNAFLSLHHLIKVADFHFPVGEFILLPIFFSFFSVFIAEILPLSYLPRMIISAVFYIFLILFTQSIKKAETKLLPS